MKQRTRKTDKNKTKKSLRVLDLLEALQISLINAVINNTHINILDDSNE